MLCIYKRGGRHYYVEIQINLVEMVAIKAGKGGEEVAAATTGGKKSKKDEMARGHDAFNTARVIDAFSKRSLEYSGDPSDALWKMIAAGSLLRVVLDKATITDAQVKQLVEALASNQCRVKDLSMLECKGITTIPEGLWVYMEVSKVRKSNPDVLDLSEWTDLRELPDSAWKLTHLKTLNLASCDELETLPETGVAGLVNLEVLDLNYCTKLKQLPQSIAKLTKLKTLNLEGCWENLETLPETGVAGLVNLEELNLGGCSELKQLPQSIAKLTKLKTLNLEECDENLETLPETGVAGLVNLEELNLGGCKKLKQLPQSIAKLTKLKTLNLEECDELETLPETGVAGLVNLEGLYVNWCKKLKQLPQSIAKLTKLKTLNLEFCDNLETLPETGVAGLVNLEGLYVSGSQFDTMKLKQLPQSIAKLTKLKTLDLGCCENLETLPETGVAGLVNLEELNLYGCKKLKQLPQSIATLTKLKTLNLKRCENIAEPLPDLSHLYNLPPGLEIAFKDYTDAHYASDAAEAWEKRGFTSLANRGKIMKMLADGTLHTHADDVLNLAGSDIETLPDSLGKLSHLKTLTLGCCENLETLPETGVAGLVNLEVLILYGCTELKQLPQSIAKLTKLKTLNLEWCYELETLPETGVAGLVNLEELNLYGCKKLKQLPRSIAKLTKLKTLNLGSCDNLETLSETGVAGLVNLEELNVATCSKLKQLPQSIAKLTKLKTLYLGGCKTLAEPLPDLSHLLPGLKIEHVDIVDVTVHTWETRGLTSLAN
eukprot:gene32553-biopygen16336